MQVEDDTDLTWAAALSGVDEPRCRAIAAELRDDRSLFEHIAREHRAEGRPSYVEIDAPEELYTIARLLRPRHVVEVGVSSGVSSAYLLKALARNGAGTLHSIDLPSFPKNRRTGRSYSSWTLPPGRNPGWAIPDDLRDRWDLTLGDKADLIPYLAERLPRVEMFVYDVPHECGEAGREFRALDPKMAEGGVAIVDHGSSRTLCPGLRAWARRRASRAVGREGLGLFGARLGPRVSA
ncbi:MAG TPA: class I SAM-dependent methyltransferase [Thermoplasmata archaeon]|jgi:hypothetical protein|nr:class I SAM-dependent methyltransferase [Thermoplasmata archaeon]